MAAGPKTVLTCRAETVNGEGSLDDSTWRHKVDLAAAVRLADRFGLSEGISNHFSYAPDLSGERFLLHPFGLHWSEVRAGDIVTVDAAGDALDGDGEIERSAFVIHSRVHRACPRARCVLHTHMPYATALSLLEDTRLEPVEQNALRFYGDIAYDDGYAGLALAEEEGDRLALALGDKQVLFMSNHGVLVVGETIAETFDALYYLERACQVQVLARSTGRPFKPIGANQAAATAASFREPPVSEEPAKHFAALRRLLDRDDPSYAH